MGIRFDIKRKSAHDENTVTLKAHAEKAKAQAAAKPAVPKTRAEAEEKS